MENTTAIASAAIGAVVAVGVTLITDHVQKAKAAKAREAEVTAAYYHGHERGHYEGRESVLQHFAATAQPSDFNPTR